MKQLTEEFLLKEGPAAKSNSISSAKKRRAHQMKMERLMHHLLKERGSFLLSEIHEVSSIIGFETKTIAGGVLAKLSGSEYVKSEKDENVKGLVYKKGRRFRDWGISLYGSEG